jgi:hypothetical protein
MLERGIRDAAQRPNRSLTPTVLYAFVKAQTRALLRSMSWNSLRTEGSGLIISSKGKDPSHLSLKSRASRCYECVSDMECIASGYRFTYVMMLYEST